MERVSSFFSSGRRGRVGGGKRDRDQSSPSGGTPVRETKHFLPEKIPEGTSVRWSREERDKLMQYVENAGRRPLGDVQCQFWKSCSDFIFDTLGVRRTAKSCQTKYERDRALKGSIGTIEPVNSVDIGVQTEPALPIDYGTVKKSSSRTNWSYLALSLEDLNPTNSACVTEGSQSLHRHACKRLIHKDNNSDINFTEKATLINAVLNLKLEDVAEAVFLVKPLRSLLWTLFLEEVEYDAARLTTQQSVLFSKGYEALSSFSWDVIINEMTQHQPLLTDVLLAVSLPTSQIGHTGISLNLVPRIGMAYSILLQSRNHLLSRVQRVMSMNLLHLHAAEKIFDSLQRSGLCLNYATTLKVADMIGGHFNEQLITAVKVGRKFRLIGDNVNFEVGVRYERGQAHKHMLHWFGSAAIIQSISFEHLLDTPQGMARHLPTEQLLPCSQDILKICSDYTILVGRVAVKHMPYFAWMKNILPQHILGPYSSQLANKTPIIPLPVRPYNEQKYAEVVHILEDYENILQDAFQKADKELDGIAVHVGGDQLTRERFSGAKRLRAGCFTAKDRFDHLRPITFEFFHLEMKVLTMFFKAVFKTNSTDIGTMHAEKIRINRHSVNEDVKTHYNADKDFAVSFIDSYIVESLCDFFGMKEVTDFPTEHIPPDFHTVDEQKAWVDLTFGQYFKEYVFSPIVTGQDQAPTTNQPPSYLPVQVYLPDGSLQTIQILVNSNPIKAPVKSDHSKAYAHSVLQFGLLYKQTLDMCKLPDRDRILSTLKVIMVALKAQSTRSKYALEILRLLCHQQATLSLKMAHESLYGLFVNSAGHIDSNFPADLAMEHLVQVIKSMLKSMGPNKGPQAVIKRTKSIAGMDKIHKNLVQTSSVIQRAKNHKTKSAEDDESKMISSLRGKRPFVMKPGASFTGFEKIEPSTMYSPVNSGCLDSWVNHHKWLLDQEISQ